MLLDAWPMRYIMILRYDMPTKHREIPCRDEICIQKHRYTDVRIKEDICVKEDVYGSIASTDILQMKVVSCWYI